MSGGREQRCAAASSLELSPNTFCLVSISAAVGVHVLASMDGHDEGEPALMVCLLPWMFLCVHESHSRDLTGAGGVSCCPPMRLLKSQCFLWNPGFSEGV